MTLLLKRSKSKHCFTLFYSFGRNTNVCYSSGYVHQLNYIKSIGSHEVINAYKDLPTRTIRNHLNWNDTDPLRYCFHVNYYCDTLCSVAVKNLSFLVCLQITTNHVVGSIPGNRHFFTLPPCVNSYLILLWLFPGVLAQAGNCRPPQRLDHLQ